MPAYEMSACLSSCLAEKFVCFGRCVSGETYGHDWRVSAWKAVTGKASRSVRGPGCMPDGADADEKGETRYSRQGRSNSAGVGLQVISQIVFVMLVG